MKRITSLLGGIGLVALQACSAAPQEEGQNLASSENAASPYAYIPTTLDWGTGYTAEVIAVNPLTVAAKNWQVIVDLKGGSIQLNSSGQPNWWGAVGNRQSGIISFVPSGTQTSVAPGTSPVLFTFNTIIAAGAPHAEIKEYNFVLDTFKTC